MYPFVESHHKMCFGEKKKKENESKMKMTWDKKKMKGSKQGSNLRMDESGT